MTVYKGQTNLRLWGRFRQNNAFKHIIYEKFRGGRTIYIVRGDENE